MNLRATLGAKKVQCEHWDCVQKLMKYNSLGNGNKERIHNHHCVGLRGLKLGHRICSREVGSFTIVIYGEKFMKVNP
jgi:hypothetical protein